VQAYLASAGLSKAIGHYERGDAVFSQGEAGTQVFYIQSGIVKLSVVSKMGREAVVAILGRGDFFGEGCLAGQRLRRGSACAIASSVILAIDKDSLVALLQRQPALSARFLSHLLTRNIRMEEDLLDQLFNTSEKRLARALLLLARDRGPGSPARVVPRISQNTLADMVGTTRSRVNFFLNKFKKRGFIAYDGERPMTVNSSLSAVLQG
jgi:CRP-like cAMP-binding protein